VNPHSANVVLMLSSVQI